MDKDDKFWLYLWSMMILAAIIISVCGFLYTYNMKIGMARMGFQETTIVGSSITVYQKIP